MSVAVYNCFLIGKMDVSMYMKLNKKVIEKKLLEFDDDFVDLSSVKDLINLYVKKGYNVYDISKLIFNQELGTHAVTNWIDELDKETVKKYISPMYNHFFMNIFISIIHPNINGYMIIGDNYNLLKDFYLADLSFHTGTDEWVDKFLKAIKKYGLVTLEKDKYDTVFKLTSIIEENNFEAPRCKIEVYDMNRTFNFISDHTIIAMIAKSVKNITCI